MFYAHLTSLLAATAPGGDEAAIASCQCYGGTGRIACEVHALGVFPAVTVVRQGTGCSAGIVLGTAGAEAVLGFTDAATLHLVGSRGGRDHGLADGETADRMAFARADADRAVFAWRSADGALDAATVAQVSPASVEAGESELATDGQHVYVVWQEITGGARGA